MIVIEVSLKENLKNKKIIKIENTLTQKELLKIISNKFNTKIISIVMEDTYENHEFNIENFFNSNPNLELTKSTQIKLICSPNPNPDSNPDLTKFIIPNVFTKIYALNSYIPTEAQMQLSNLNSLRGVKYLIGMPDLHQGKYPVGSVVITDSDNIYPELVGPDIGCGMSLIKTQIQINKFSSKQLERIADKINIGNFTFDLEYTEQMHLNNFYSNNIVIHSNSTNIINSQPIDSKWINNYNYNYNYDIINKEKIAKLIEYLSSKYLNSMGTIGLGNHFVELLQLDKIKSDELISKYQIDSNHYYILVHSGSRGLGEEILQLFQSNQISSHEYKILHDYGVDWAKHNRYAIASQFAYWIGTEFEYIVDLTHNWVEMKEINSIVYNIHRKGAAPAYTLPIIIPGSRGTRTWFVEPNILSHSLESGFSVSHGAGRKISRNKACEGMKEKTQKDREICCQGDPDISNIVICQDANLFYEEAPFAYKDIQSVIDDLEHFKLASPICSFIPVITFKCRK